MDLRERMALNAPASDAKVKAAEEQLAEEFSERAAAAKREAAEAQAAGTDDVYERLLEEMLESKLECRSSVYQQFMRDPQGGASTEYKEADNKTRKQRLQKKWLSLKLTTYRAEKETVESHQKIDKSKGKYKSLKVLADKEGLEKATMYARKCFALGGPWIEWDTMWEHWTFFETEIEYVSIFTKAWAIHMKSTSDTPGQSSSSNSAEAQRELPEEAAEEETDGAKAGGGNEPKGKAKPKAKQQPGGKRAAGSTSDGPPAKTRNKATTEAKAAALKQMYTKATTSANALLSLIVSDESWQTFTSDATLKPIRDAKKALDEAVNQDTFFSDYFMMDIKDSNTKYLGRVASMCGHMLSQLEQPVQNLHNEAKSLVKQKLIRDRTLTKAT